MTSPLGPHQDAGHAPTGAPLPGSVLVVAPHPDDETLGCGGTVIQLIRNGARVHVVFVTDGSASHAHLMDRSALRRIRRDEALAAAGILGVADEDVLFLDYQDGALAAHQDAAVADVLEAIRRCRPDEVFVPYRHDAHPDHEITNTIVRSALARSGLTLHVNEYPVWCLYQWPRLPLPRRLDGMAHAMLRNTLRSGFGYRTRRAFTHSVFVGDVLETKRAALEAHRSQMTPLLPDTDWPTLTSFDGGHFLSLFFNDHEVFHRYPLPPPRAAVSQDDGLMRQR